MKKNINWDLSKLTDSWEMEKILAESWYSSHPYPHCQLAHVYIHMTACCFSILERQLVKWFWRASEEKQKRELREGTDIALLRINRRLTP